MKRLLEGLSYRIPQSSPAFAVIWPEGKIWKFCKGKLFAEMVTRLNNEVYSREFADTYGVPPTASLFFSANPQYIMFVAVDIINADTTRRGVHFIKTMMPHKLSSSQFKQLKDRTPYHDHITAKQCYENNCNHLPPHPEEKL